MSESPSLVFHRLSRAWSRLCGIRKFMILRCYDPRQRSFPAYGGRGVIVCGDWLEGPENFFDWAMANGYAEDLGLDRKEPDGNYEPSNCRWATRTENQGNCRKQRAARVCTSEFKGVSKQRRSDGTYRITAQINVGRKLVRIGTFADEAEAARAYDRAALEKFGSFARLNFPLQVVGS